MTVNGVTLDVLDEKRFCEAFAGFVRCGESHVVHFLSAHPTVIAREAPGYRNLLNSADLAVSDGAPVALVMRLADRAAHRVTGTDGFIQIIEHGVAAGLRHYFVGGSTAAAAAALRVQLTRRYPGVQIVGFEVPPFRRYNEDELLRLAESIHLSAADVVWIGLGTPGQDILAHRLRAGRAAPVIACVGAAFDFVAETKPRAPWWMQEIGLEWLFRLLMEPRRLGRRYVIGNARFISGVVGDAITHARVRFERHLSAESSATTPPARSPITDESKSA